MLLVCVLVFRICYIVTIDTLYAQLYLTPVCVSYFASVCFGKPMHEGGIALLPVRPLADHMGQRETQFAAFCPIEGICPVCAGLHRLEADFVAAVSDRPRAIAAAAEDVVESLGFCGHHGAILTQHPDKAPTIARILWAATDRMIEWLADERLNAERLFGVFFAADRMCVLCKLQDHHAARHIHRLFTPPEWDVRSRWLCFPHYRDVAYQVKSPELPALAASQLGLLKFASAEIGSIAEQRWAGAKLPPVAAETLRVVAGDAEPAWEPARLGRIRSKPVRASADGWSNTRDDSRSCSVCAEIGLAERRWSSAVKTAAGLGRDLWTVFPTCAAHVRLCAQFGDEQIAIMAARHAASVELAALRRGIEMLDRDNNNREVAAKSVFYRRQSPGYVLGQQRRMITDVPRCPTCARLIVAQERAVDNVLKKLREGLHSYLSEHIAGLCLKHFASAYLLAPHGESRSTLATLQTRKLLQLRTRLAQSRDSSDPIAANDAVREAIHTWGTVMLRLDSSFRWRQR